MMTAAPIVTNSKDECGEAAPWTVMCGGTRVG